MSIVKPVSGRRDAAVLIEDYESKAGVAFAENIGQWPVKDGKNNRLRFTFPNMHQGLTLGTGDTTVINAFSGRYDRTLTIGRSHMELGEDAEPIDSLTLRDALVAGLNFGSEGHIFINGIDLLAFGEDGVLVSAPLPIDCLALATRGGFIKLHGATARLLASLLYAAEYRAANGLGDAPKAAATVKNNIFSLRVTGGKTDLLWECGVEVRPYFQDDVVAKVLLAEPSAVGTFDAESLVRAYHRAVKDAGFTEPKEIVSREHRPHAIVACGDGQVLVSRLPVEDGYTKDDSAWAYQRVSNSESGASTLEWAVLNGNILRVLPYVGERFNVGICKPDAVRSTVPTPVLFWTDKGVKITAPSAWLHAYA